jgi:hypothetical protein
MSRVLQASIRAGEKTTRTAERLLHADQPQVHLPRYVRELQEAARFPRGPGDPNLYEDAVKRWTKQVARLGQGSKGGIGEFTLRSASQQLIADLRKAKPAQVDKVVNRWVLERARYQARVVARHESVEAFRDQSVKQWQEQEWVKGVRWALSPSHRHRDVCDVLANQDLYGLGPGGYPLDRIPSRHVSDLCSQSPIVDAHHQKREIAKLKGTEEPPKPWLSGRKETGEEWLMRQPEAAQRAIAGPTRARMLKQGKRIMTRDNAEFRKVHNLLGKPKPERDMGPKVDATKLVKADRASMVQQYPAL